MLSRWPKSYDEAVEQAVRELSEDDVAYIRSLEHRDLPLLYHGLGLSLRNRFGLWQSNCWLLESCAAKGGPLCSQPDSAVALIITGMWEALRKGLKADGDK